MSPELSAWMGQIPWVPLGVVAALVVVFWFTSRGGKKNREQLVAKIAAGAKVVDVRTKGEYAGGHFTGAVNIPVDTISSKLKSLGGPDTPLVVYCASGGRSSQAASILRAAGFTDVTNAGGLASMPKAR
jgi:phage shock protein E